MYRHICTHVDRCMHTCTDTHTHTGKRERFVQHTSAPIMTGVPSSLKCLSNSLPVLPISVPLGTLVMREVTPRRWFKTILTSNEPIHCLEPKKDDSLSPTSISACIKQQTKISQGRCYLPGWSRFNQTLNHATSLSTQPTLQQCYLLIP